MVLLLILGAFYLGMAYTTATLFVTSKKADGIVIDALEKNQNIVADVENVIDAEYIGSIDQNKLFYGLMKGLVAGLDDPYSEFFDPEESRLFWEDVNGEYEGIGVEIALRNGVAQIMSVLDNSPAAGSGIEPGDIILSVDDQDVEGKTLSEVAAAIKGEKGSMVKLLLLRDTELLEKNVARDKLAADSVYVKNDNDLLWVEIYRFDEDTDIELKNKLKSFDLNTISGIILDVRSNPGGYFDSSVAVADEFLTSGLIVSEKDGNEQIERYYADAGDDLETVPLVVLVDSYSASAAEILAGAIKDNGRGEVVGEKSYGKGSVQIIENLSDGSTLKITTAEWLTPNGHNLRQDGIVPDYIVANDSVDVDKQYEKAKELLLERINKIG